MKQLAYNLQFSINNFSNEFSHLSIAIDNKKRRTIKSDAKYCKVIKKSGWRMNNNRIIRLLALRKCRKDFDHGVIRWIITIGFSVKSNEILKEFLN